MKPLLLIVVVAAALLVACGGRKAPTPEEACRGLDSLTAVQRAERGCYIGGPLSADGRPATPDPQSVKRAAMAQANSLVDYLSAAIPSQLSPEEKAALRPARVLEEYARIIHDTELEAQAAALYQQTKAAYEAAHAPAPPPVIVVRPGAPVYQPAPDTFELDRLKRKVNELCLEVGDFC